VVVSAPVHVDRVRLPEVRAREEAELQRGHARDVARERRGQDAREALDLVVRGGEGPPYALTEHRPEIRLEDGCAARAF
jgi:hypothetical protein